MPCDTMTRRRPYDDYTRMRITCVRVYIHMCLTIYVQSDACIYTYVYVHVCVLEENRPRRTKGVHGTFGPRSDNLFREQWKRMLRVNEYSRIK